MKRPSTRTILLIASALCECAAFFVMAQLRYKNQLLSTNYFDFTKNGNVLYALYALVMLWCALRIGRKKNGKTVSLAWLAGLSAVSLILLFIMIWLPAAGHDNLYAAIGIIKIVNLGLATTLEGHEHHSAFVTTIQHTAIVVIFLFGGTLIYGLLTPTDVPSTEHADTAVVLGAAVWSKNRPSPLLRMRINKALDLVTAKNVSDIVCTGSNAYGEHTEADVERAELIKAGFDSTHIITESKSNSTIAQIMFMRDSLQRRGFHSFIVVSDHFHLQRALEMARFNDLRVLGEASESTMGWESLLWYRVRDAAALLLYWAFGI
ncbi:MAG TPA: YdcF family protein [Candidatus Kapabacteria bacterium]|nr:YdcF family protein [Candidatus Kapabacteria bacterium]